MYYRTNGAYRRSKMTIDVMNIILTATIGILFIGIFFFKDWRDILFPSIFAAGGLTNALTGIKSLMNYNKITGIVLMLVSIALFILAAVCWQIL